MKRNGKTLKALPDGAPRRLSDGRNAWRKMSDAQRAEFIAWINPIDLVQALNANDIYIGEAPIELIDGYGEVQT